MSSWGTLQMGWPRAPPGLKNRRPSKCSPLVIRRAAKCDKISRRLEIRNARERTMACPAACVLARHLRDHPHVDADHRQNQAETLASREPLVACPSLCDVARPDDVPDSIGFAHVRC